MPRHLSLRPIHACLPSLLVFVLLAGLGSPVDAQYHPMTYPDAPSNPELLARLEAAEQELVWLRAQQPPQTTWEHMPAARSANQAAAFTHAELKSTELLSDQCECGYCGDVKPVCQAAGAFCDVCKDQLSWNKGSWRIVPFGFPAGEAIATSSQAVARPFILYVRRNDRPAKTHSNSRCTARTRPSDSISPARVSARLKLVG